MLKIAAAILAFAVCLPSAADAKRHHHRKVTHRATVASEFCGDRYCGGGAASPSQNIRSVEYGGGQIVAHPAGCPRIAFCGCSSWKYLTGQVVTRGGPAQARWWYRFPTAAPAAGMAEVRPHHVRVIITAYGDGTAMFYDGNSGGHLTRIHRDRIRGRIVNPNVTRYAQS